jgi:hypothetical protein
MFSGRSRVAEVGPVGRRWAEEPSKQEPEHDTEAEELHKIAEGVRSWTWAS